MARILILGSAGMAGHLIHLYLHEAGHEVLGIDKVVPKSVPNVLELDLFNLEKVDTLIASGFDAIVNCVGILNKVAEDNPHLAVYLNSYIPNWFVYRLRATRTKFIHLSTDCVFSGKVGGYAEHDFRDGDTGYDRSKALGEIRNSKDLTFRQSIIGPELRPDGIGLLNWFLMRSGQVNGYKNALWNGITTLELAKAIEVALSSQLAGIYHLVNSEKVSKNALLNIMKDAFRKKDVSIQPFDNFPATDKSLRCTRNDFNYSIPSYQVMMNELEGWVSKHSHLYQHYQIS